MHLVIATVRHLAVGERPSADAATLADSSVHGQFEPGGQSYPAAPGDGRSPVPVSTCNREYGEDSILLDLSEYP
jgi:hypothetical protein